MVKKASEDDQEMQQSQIRILSRDTARQINKDMEASKQFK